MQNEKLSREEFLIMFREDVTRLSRYIPWFEKKSGSDVSQNYTDGNKMEHTLSFPVYDSILLSFLNDASMTVFMEQNYHYFYNRKRIQNFEDELRLIETADIMHMEVLQCILSRYVFGGMTKAYLWKDGVEHRIFLSILKKARQIVEFNSQPLVVEDEIFPEEEEIVENALADEIEETPEDAWVEEIEESEEDVLAEEIEESEEDALTDEIEETPEDALTEEIEETTEEPEMEETVTDEETE